MLEIVFSDSACGSLKMAQHYGQGSIRAVASVLSSADQTVENHLKEKSGPHSGKRRKLSGLRGKAAPQWAATRRTSTASG